MNSLIVYGLNYHSCPVAIRERFTIPESCLEHALHALKQLPHVLEAVVLSTCNRTEVYALVNNIASGFKELESFFQATRQVADHEALKADFKLIRDDVALHLFRVASGLDSMVLGEGQIMSQVKAAHQAALKTGSAGPILDALFKSALNCGKKVRTQTGLSRRAVSISSAAVELTRQLLANLESRSVLVVGAGRMGQICVKLLLAENNSCTVYVTNRNQNKIKALQAANTQYLDRLHIIDFAERHKITAKCDAVIVATSAKEFVLNEEGMLRAKKELGREQIDKYLHIVDMSVPRNVDPQLSQFPNIAVYNFDNLAQIVKHNLAEREALIKDAEIIIFASLKEFSHWQQTLFVAPVIAELRGKVENIRQSYLRHRIGASFSLDSPQRAAKKSNREQERASKQLDKVSRVIVNQILHKPTTRLKAVRDYRSLQQQIEALQSLFDLSPLGKAPKIEIPADKT
jgi:glutamyl-tRNA reductase